MDLKARIQQDMKTALKAQDSLRLSTLRMLFSEVRNREIDSRTTLSEADIQKAVQSLVKSRNDSVEAFQKGGRQDLADKEKKEIEILKVYLPAQMSATEVEALVSAAIKEVGATKPEDIGKVMKLAMSKATGRADGKVINEVARRQLTPSPA